MKHFKNNAEHKRGFTLIELIVVIAILAIIAAIAVPTAFASLENARAAACRANINDMLSAWRIEQATELLAKGTSPTTVDTMIKDALTNCGIDITDSDVFKTDTAGNVYEVHNLCPSGGFYTITIVKEGSGSDSTYTGAITIGCDVHTGTGPVSSAPENPAATDPLSYNGVDYNSLADLINALSLGNPVDSTAAGETENLDTELAAIQEALHLDSIDDVKRVLADEYGMVSWTVRTSGSGSSKKTTLRWSTIDVTTITTGNVHGETDPRVGPVIPVIKYDGSTYTLVAANVFKETKTGTDYNIIRNSTEAELKSSANYDDILTAYNEALKLYEEGTLTKTTVIS